MTDDTWGTGRPPVGGGEGGRRPSASETRTAEHADESVRDEKRSVTPRAEGSDENETPSDVNPSRTGPLRAVDPDLAPVIPLFGRSDASRSELVRDTSHPSRRRSTTDEPTTHESTPAPDPSVGRPRLRALNADALTEPSSGARWNIPGGDTPGGRAFGTRGETRARGFSGGSITDAGGSTIPRGVDGDLDDAAERAEALLLRKLRSRSLSLAEARTVIRGVDGADETVVEDLVARFVDLGYLDDAAFAEQLAMSAVERRGDGRRAVAETLRKRGIPREVAEAALAELPDDDAERALEFARSKVRGVEGKDYESALRRLAGQLARRGYPSSVALTAARTALSEAGLGRSRSFSRPSSGVRFTPDD